MNSESTSRFALWHTRKTMPKLHKGASAVLLFLIAAAAGISTTGWGGLLTFSFTGALLAFLLTADRSPLWIVSIPLTYLVSVLTQSAFSSGKSVWLTALLSLFFVPVGIVLAICIYGRQKLTVTVSALCVLFCVMMLGMGAVVSFHTYGSVAEGFQVVTDSVREMITESLLAVSELSQMTEADIRLYADSAVMLLPAIFVLCMELFAYLTAKLYRLLTILFATDYLVPAPRWALTASLPAYLVFLISYLISMFSTEVSVIYYAAANLMYIFLPVTAVAGFHIMFGKKSRFRCSMSRGGRIGMIVLCVLALYLAPLYLAILFAFWGAASTIGGALRRWMQRRSHDGDSDSM